MIFEWKQLQSSWQHPQWQSCPRIKERPVHYFCNILSDFQQRKFRLALRQIEMHAGLAACRVAQLQMHNQICLSAASSVSKLERSGKQLLNTLPCLRHPSPNQNPLAFSMTPATLKPAAGIFIPHGCLFFKFIFCLLACHGQDPTKFCEASRACPLALYAS